MPPNTTMYYIFGHKNPDSDSVCSAICMANLKNLLGQTATPYILGDINKETTFILNRFEVETPQLLSDVKVQVKDLSYDEIPPVTMDKSILHAYNSMTSGNIRTLPIVSEDNHVKGVLTMKDIAMNFISGENRKLKTSIKNIIDDFNGNLINGDPNTEIEGDILVMSLYYKTIRKNELLNRNTISVLGDNYDNILFSIQSKVKLMIITSGRNLPSEHLELAILNEVPIISVPTDTFETARKLCLCNYVSDVMISKKIIRFKENHYLDEIKEDMATYRYTNYPVVSSDKKYLGMINRNHIINPKRKECIMVDHNEYAQSVIGLNEADVIEIVDHHKIGDIKTSTPILFRNMPVGSTCTIIYSLYAEHNIDIPKNIAGLLMSGIISDTMLFKSPTTTVFDKEAVNSLNKIVDIDINEYALEMFKAGSSLKGLSVEDIVYNDLKEFDIEGFKTTMSQIFTLNIKEIMDNSDAYLDYLEQLHNSHGNNITLLTVTDIINEGSYIFYKTSTPQVIKKLFDGAQDQGHFLAGVVSRKKQLIPTLTDCIIAYKNNL